MPPEVDAVADSSPAPVAPVSASDRLANLSDAELQDWRSGKTSTRDLVTKEPSAASPAASPEVPAASTEVSPPPASEPGTPIKPKTEARFQELLTDRAKERDRGDRLERELADLRRQITAPRVDVPPAAPSPAAVKTLAETIATPDVAKPSLTEAEFFHAFPDAPYGDFGRYVARYEYRALQQAERQEQQQQHLAREKAERWTAFEQRRIAADAADPGFLSKLGLPLDRLIPVDQLPAGTTPTAWNDLAQAIVESPSAVPILRHLGTHPELVQALVGSATPQALARAFGKLEAQFEASGSTVPPVPTITTAPPPPPTLGTRPGEPGDRVQQALRDKDTGRYIREMNARDLAARR